MMVGDCYFGWVFQCDFVVIGMEGVCWQVFDQVIVFYVVDCCVLVEVFECVGQVCGYCVGSVVLQEFVVVVGIDVFNEVEFFYCGFVFWVVWQVVQEVWYGQVYIVVVFVFVE